MTIRYFAVFLALVAALGQSHALWAQSGPDVQPSPAAARPNVIVVVVDDLRYDEFGAGGHPYLETPNIDRLASEGALFTNVFHAVPLCSPNRASILTGQYPSRHGIIDNVARNQASHRLETFPRAMQDGGYETGFRHRGPASITGRRCRVRAARSIRRSMRTAGFTRWTVMSRTS